MFSFSLALVPLFVLSIHAHSIRLNSFPATTEQKLALFGQLQQSVDQSNQLSVPSSHSDLSDDDQEQLTPISCYRVRANIKNPVPNDSSKYFVCRNEFNYEIYTCPNGGVFDNTQKACLDLCQQNNPCMNQGQCIILPDLKLECVCRRDWTGERCETPLSSCAKNPCGPNAECRMLKTPDFDQDYVCICDNYRTYGKSCQRTVPNPCLSNTQQFHPFAFSRRAYINCDDEMIFFQPCNALLYWNQEEKRCDRALPDILRAPFMNLKPKIKQLERVVMDRPQLTQWRGNTDGINEENIVVVMLQKPVTVEFTRWLETRIPEIQQIQQTNSPRLTQLTGSQMPFTSNQRFVTPSTPAKVPNQQMSMRPFMETTTTPSNVFRLQGFGNRPTANMGMSQTASETSSFFETTTLAPDTSKFSLSGWKSTPQQEAAPTMQLRSWKE